MSNFVNKHIKWVFSLPVLIFMAVMVVIPIVMTLVFSLCDWNLLMGTGMKLNWGKNYLDVLGSREFWQSLAITFYYTGLATVAELLLGVAIALILNREFIGKNAVKTIVLLPYMMAPVAVGLMWMLFYEPSSGLINYIFSVVGLPRSSFVSAKETVIPAIAVVETWQMTPMVVIVCLAGLSSLPADPMEAARVDGATPVQAFFKITLPMISPQIFFTLIVLTIGSFKIFDMIFIMTGGGPNNASTSLVFYIYSKVFQEFDMGKAAAAGVVLMALVGIMTVFYFVGLSKKVHYQ